MQQDGCVGDLEIGMVALGIEWKGGFMIFKNELGRAGNSAFASLLPCLSAFS